jgi:hypothetical protein
MHPRRWAWLCAQSDSSLRPLVAIEGLQQSFNAVGAGVAGYGYAPVLSIAGGIPWSLMQAFLPIVLGASTDEDQRNRHEATAMFCSWKTPGLQSGLPSTRLLQPALNVTMVTYGYSAFTAGRYVQ